MPMEAAATIDAHELVNGYTSYQINRRIRQEEAAAFPAVLRISRGLLVHLLTIHPQGGDLSTRRVSRGQFAAGKSPSGGDVGLLKKDS